MSGKLGLNGSKISLILLVIVATILALVGYRQAPAAVVTERHFFENSGGAVVFDHQQHADVTEGCESCHHHLVRGEQYTECLDCHDDSYSAADFTHTELLEIKDHECNYCHELHEDRSPQTCRQCHAPVQDASPPTLNCSECHDFEADDAYIVDLDLSHEDLLDIHEEDCSTCHQPQSISAAYHLQCISCHEQKAAMIFGKNAAEWDCQACHLK